MSINILPFRVYQVLLEYTDGDHALPMGELLRLLRTEYGLRCDRRAVYAALDKLRAVGCHIPEYQDDGEGYRLLSRPLEPSEVRLLSDAASAFPGISQRQCQRLLKKLGRSLSCWQREQCRPLPVKTPWRGVNQEAFLSVEVLEEAVSRRCQVRFQYMKYGMDKKLHPRQERPYQVSPYGLYFTNGNYYLLCRYQGAENISHYRVDRIQSPVLLEKQPAEPLPSGLDMERYVRERAYPFSGKAIRAVLHCEIDLLSDVLDRFGMETQLRDNGDGTFDAVVLTGAAGLKFWALQYVAACQVVEPEQLRREICDALRAGWEAYQKIQE
ncbi:MAG: WYL domain-containing protein [Oscillospiraceae bacterium]|nr:WYL domain-containing protein [Oscillospiraceae bacterium]